MFDYFISPPFILLTFPFVLFFLWLNLCLSPHPPALHPHRESSLLTQESKKALSNPTIPQRQEEPIIVVCLRGRGEEFQELHTHTHTQSGRAFLFQISTFSWSSSLTTKMRHITRNVGGFSNNLSFSTNACMFLWLMYLHNSFDNIFNISWY